MRNYKTFFVKCFIKQDQPLLIPGMFVKTEFILEERRNIFILPFDILMDGNKLWFLGQQVAGDSLFRADSMEYTPIFYNNDYFQIEEKFTDLFFLKEGQDFIYRDQVIRLKSGPGLSNKDL